jgi:hypothetical protein
MVPVSIWVGISGGTGTATTLGRGTANLVGGTLTTQHFGIGTAGGTGSSIGTAVGEVTVTSGNIILEDSLLDGAEPRTSLTIGSSGGSGSFNGNATGTLRVIDGRVVADDIAIGRTSPIAFASGSSQGNFYLENSDVDMMTMTLGASSNNGGPATGLFQQIGGITTGDSLSLGPTSKIVLGIGGPVAGAQYSQILVDDASLGGVFEASFVDGFLPAPGDVFDLVVADNISGSYDFQITGIDPANYPNLVITRNDQLIRLTFVVPEPGAIAVVALSSIIILSQARRRG